jgi:hypothetical protein
VRGRVGSNLNGFRSRVLVIRFRPRYLGKRECLGLVSVILDRRSGGETLNGQASFERFFYLPLQTPRR